MLTTDDSARIAGYPVCVPPCITKRLQWSSYAQRSGRIALFAYTSSCHGPENARTFHEIKADGIGRVRVCEQLRIRCIHNVIWDRPFSNVVTKIPYRLPMLFVDILTYTSNKGSFIMPPWWFCMYTKQYQFVCQKLELCDELCRHKDYRVGFLNG